MNDLFLAFLLGFLVSALLITILLAIKEFNKLKRSKLNQSAIRYIKDLSFVR